MLQSCLNCSYPRFHGSFLLNACFFSRPSLWSCEIICFTTLPEYHLARYLANHTERQRFQEAEVPRVLRLWRIRLLNLKTHEISIFETGHTNNSFCVGVQLNGTGRKCISDQEHCKLLWKKWRTTMHVILWQQEEKKRNVYSRSAYVLLEAFQLQTVAQSIPPIGEWKYMIRIVYNNQSLKNLFDERWANYGCSS